MKNRITAISIIAALALASCSSTPAQSTAPTEAATEAATEEITEAAAEEQTEEPTEPVTEAATEAATEHETAPQNEVGYEGMEAVEASSLNEGDYHISVDSSSSMFKIADCILHVADDAMTADIIIDSKSYDLLFMGTEDEADKAARADCIAYTVNDSGQSVFTVPVEALDAEVQCAALSAKKQEWYGRTLVFRADSLPDEAFYECRYTTASELGLEDGEYTCDVSLEGGSGRASVQSPCKVIVKDGYADAEIVWSSDKYDLMIIEGGNYLPEIIDGHSVFTIDIIGFDYKMPVGARTTAMSEPHTIDYKLYFDSETLQKCE
ncbi:MAG: hypothetical protein J5501_09425 [Ruminococcus sp.]|nr:hypothetical protein [Ruminococcus sp.]